MSVSEETKSKYDLGSLNKNWKKCLSRRMKKFYYYNSVTKESKWSLEDVTDSLKNIESKESISSGSGLHPDRPNRQALKNGHMFPEPEGPPTLDEVQLSDFATAGTDFDNNMKLKLLNDLLREPMVNQMLESHLKNLLSKQRTEAGSSASKNSHVTSTENINASQSTDVENPLRSIGLSDHTLERIPSQATGLPLNERFRHKIERRRSASLSRVSSSKIYQQDRNNFENNMVQEEVTSADSCTEIDVQKPIEKSDVTADISPDSQPDEENNMEEESAVDEVLTQKVDVTKKTYVNSNLQPNDLRLRLRNKRRRQFSESYNNLDDNQVQDHCDNAGTLFLFDESKLEKRLKEYKEKSMLETSASENDESPDYGDANSMTSNSKRVTFATNTKATDDSLNSNTAEDDGNLELEFSAININLERLVNLYQYIPGEGDWYLVVDTNILLSNLCFIQALREISEASDIAPLILIPWKVLSELDDIKDTNKKLHMKLRRAKSFLNDHLATQVRNSKVFGQTVLEDSSKMFKCRCPDDEILNCCMQKVNEGYRVGLLSNDINLCNKAIVNNIPAYSVKNLKILLQEDNIEESNESIINSNEAVSRFDKNELSSIQIFVKNNKNQRPFNSNTDVKIDEKKIGTGNEKVITLKRTLENKITNLDSNTGESFSALIRNMACMDKNNLTNPKHVMAISSSLGSLKLSNFGGSLKESEFFNENSSSITKKISNDEMKISSTTEKKTRKREPIVYNENDLKQKHHVLKKTKFDLDTNAKKAVMNCKVNDSSKKIFRQFNLENPSKNMVSDSGNRDIFIKTMSNPLPSDKKLQIFRTLNVASGQTKTLKSPVKLSNVTNDIISVNNLELPQPNSVSESLGILHKEPTTKKQWFRQSPHVTSSTLKIKNCQKKVMLKRKRTNNSDSHESTSQSSSNIQTTIAKNTQNLKDNLVSTNIKPPSKNIFAEMLSRKVLNVPVKTKESSFTNVFSENKSQVLDEKMTTPQGPTNNNYRNMFKVRKNNNKQIRTAVEDCSKKSDTNEIPSMQNEMTLLEKDIISGNVVLTHLHTNNKYSKSLKYLQDVSEKLKNYEKGFKNKISEPNIGVTKRIGLIRDAVNERKEQNLRENTRKMVPQSVLWEELSIDIKKGQILIEEELESWICVIRQMIENVLSTFLEKLMSTGGETCKWILPSPWSLHDALSCLIKIMPAGSELGNREQRQMIAELATKLGQIVNKYCFAGDRTLPKPSCDAFLDFFNSCRLLISTFQELNVANWISNELEQAKSNFDTILNNLKYDIRSTFIEEIENIQIGSRSVTPEGDVRERSPSPIKEITLSKKDVQRKVSQYLITHCPNFSRKNVQDTEKILPKIISKNKIKPSMNQKSSFDKIIEEMNLSANINKNVKFNNVYRSSTSKEKVESNIFNEKLCDNPSQNNTEFENDAKFNSSKSLESKTLEKTKIGVNLDDSILTKKNVPIIQKAKFDFDQKISRTITNDRVNLNTEEKNKLEIISDKIVVPSKSLEKKSEKKLDSSNNFVQTIVRRLDFTIPKYQKIIESSGIVERNKTRLNSEDSGIVNENSSLTCEDTSGASSNNMKFDEHFEMFLALRAIDMTVTSNIEKWKNISNGGNFSSEQTSADTILSENLKMLFNGMKGYLNLELENGFVQAAEAITKICDKELNGMKITKEAMKLSLGEPLRIGFQKFEELGEAICDLMD